LVTSVKIVGSPNEFEPPDQEDKMNFGTALIGQTENALNAILDRRLEGTGLTERHWVTLAIAASGALTTGDELAQAVAGALKATELDARALIEQLSENDLIAVGEDEVVLTEAGRALTTRLRSELTEVTTRLWGDLPQEELDSAGRVLNTVLGRANAELA
jgi:DNA-binding MarR family transcriptional regulator